MAVLAKHSFPSSLCFCRHTTQILCWVLAQIHLTSIFVENNIDNVLNAKSCCWNRTNSILCVSMQRKCIWICYTNYGGGGGDYFRCVCVLQMETLQMLHIMIILKVWTHILFFFLSFVFFRSIKMMLCNLNSRALFRRRSSHCRILWFCQTKCISVCMQLHGCQLVGYHKQELIDRKCHNDRSTRRTQCARNESRFVERSRWCTDANKFLKH